MMAARWNLLRTGCGPLVQEVADSYIRSLVYWILLFDPDVNPRDFSKFAHVQVLPIAEAI